MFKKLDVLINKGFFEESDFNRALQVVEAIKRLDLNKDEKKKISIYSLNIYILKFQFQIKNTKNDDYENLINLRGKLIFLYKKLEKEAVDENEKMNIRKIYLEELKKHKEIFKSYKKSDKKIPIKKSVAMNIKDIAYSMEIFIKEKDLFKKVKNIIKDTALGVSSAALVALIVSAAVCYFTKMPFTLSTIVSCAPSAAYIGLSSLIRNVTTKTQFEKYLFINSNEYKSIVDNFYNENKDLIEEIVNDKRKSENLYYINKITANEKIIDKINILIDRTKISELKEGFELEILGLLRENKDIRLKIKDNYEEGITNNKKLYVDNNKKLMKLNIQLFNKENSIKEAFKNAGDNFVKSFQIILITKAILAAVAPGTFPLNSIDKLSTPLLITAINNLINIPTYHGKRKNKDTSYDKKMLEEEKRKLLEIINDESMMRSMALS